jgi:predicted SAM-dependent methyltransferase
MKIHVGCGRHVLEGWWNCDVQRHPRAPRDPEALCDARAIPRSDGCASVVMACHVIEHFYRWEVGEVLAEWRRLLRPGGLLILELPNLEAACRNLLAGLNDQMGMWPIYGDWNHRDPYMMHKHGYTPRTLRALLEDHGFRAVVFSAPETHGKRKDRDMRAMAVKA